MHCLRNGMKTDTFQHASLSCQCAGIIECVKYTGWICNIPVNFELQVTPEGTAPSEAQQHRPQSKVNAHDAVLPQLHYLI